MRQTDLSCSLDQFPGLYSGTDTASPLATWSYNIRGLPTARAEAGGSGMEWTWDPIERLLSERHMFVPTTSNLLATFAYNPASQIVTRTRNNDAYVWTGANRSDAYTVNGLNQYTAVNGVTHSYDANGNLTNDGTRSYTYDVKNRLISSASGGQTTTLRYDPLGRLWEVAAPSGTTRFLWDGDALVSEYDGNNGFLRRYAHGSSAGDDPITWTETGGITRYLHADHQGSIIAIAGQAGSAYAINRYDEWGRPEATNQGRFGFTGQMWLPEIGLYHYKARMYSPILGRMFQVDPVGYDDQINLYAYVGNDPVNLIDPTGNSCDSSQNSNGQTIYSCRIDYERIVGQNGSVTHRPVEAGDQRFARFNAQYTAAVNKLAAGDQNRSVTVEAVRGGRAFQITVGQAVASLVERQFIYSESGLNVDRVETGSRIPQSVPHADLGSSGVPPGQHGQTYVSYRGLSEASRADIVHDGGIHSTPQELEGGLLTDRYPLRRIPHQNQYRVAACALLGPEC